MHSLFYQNIQTIGSYAEVSTEEKKQLLQKYPDLKQWIKPFIGSREIINNIERYCFWFADSTPKQRREIFKYPEIKARIKAVKESRLKSPTKSVREWADIPYLFTQDRQPRTNYLAIPEVSSERREYIPISFLTPETIASNKIYTVPDMGLYEFGVLISTMHMDWMRVVAGRLKNDYSYSPNVYHLFPFPENDDANKEVIEKRVKAILKVRKYELKENGSSLADLYDPDGMSTTLRKAHKSLDRAVEKCYRKEKFKGVMDRLNYLFSRYTEQTS